MLNDMVVWQSKAVAYPTFPGAEGCDKCASVIENVDNTLLNYPLLFCYIWVAIGHPHYNSGCHGGDDVLSGGGRVKGWLLVLGVMIDWEARGYSSIAFNAIARIDDASCC